MIMHLQPPQQISQYKPPPSFSSLPSHSRIGWLHVVLDANERGVHQGINPDSMVLFPSLSPSHGAVAPGSGRFPLRGFNATDCTSVHAAAQLRAADGGQTRKPKNLCVPAVDSDITIFSPHPPRYPPPKTTSPLTRDQNTSLYRLLIVCPLPPPCKTASAAEPIRLDPTAHLARLALRLSGPG